MNSVEQGEKASSPQADLFPGTLNPHQAFLSSPNVFLLIAFDARDSTWSLELPLGSQLSHSALINCKID